MMTANIEVFNDPIWGRFTKSFFARPWAVVSTDPAARWQYWILPLTTAAHYCPSFADGIVVAPPRHDTEPLCTELFAYS